MYFANCKVKECIWVAIISRRFVGLFGKSSALGAHRIDEETMWTVES